MMYHYPYSGFPYYRNYSRYGYPYSTSYPNSSYKNTFSKKEKAPVIHKKQVSSPSFDTTKKEETSSTSEESPLFQIFGINLYFDDILLVCLIFFLYQEGVKDEGLFMALILLLLS